MEALFDFEKPILTVEKKLQDLRELSKREGVDLSKEIKILEKKVDSLISEVYENLTAWQRVQIARHPNRPYTRDVIDAIFPEFMELQGDRTFGDDQAILGGIAVWPPLPPGTPRQEGEKSHSVLILGHQKGRGTRQKMERNFGMARPEGYRKALRLIQVADRFKIPIITFIDTPGAYPAIEAEQRGQSQAIAESLVALSGVTVPVISIVLGEGGSGGALAIGIANKILMLEYSIYSVISPEGCASILWNDSKYAETASDKLKMTPKDLAAQGLIDGIIPEPRGAAHRDWSMTFGAIQKALLEHFGPLVHGEKKPSPEKFRSERFRKFRTIGAAAIIKPSQEPAIK